MYENEYRQYRKLLTQKNKAERKVELYQKAAVTIIITILLSLSLLLGGITFPY